MPENNQILSVEGQLIGMPTAGPESFSQQQLDYLKRALGVDETVLWSGTASSSFTLSEDIANFEYCRFKIASDQGYKYDLLAKDAGNVFTLCYTHGESNAWTTWLLLDYTPSTYNLTVRHSKSISHSFTANTASLSSSLDNRKAVIIEVVGIHRIQGGN